MIAGRFKRPIAIKQPGMFLSQPGIATKASYHWRIDDENQLFMALSEVYVEDENVTCPPMMVSILSAMTSLDCSE
jgi:hypothetical protein